MIKKIFYIIVLLTVTLLYSSDNITTDKKGLLITIDVIDEDTENEEYRCVGNIVIDKNEDIIVWINPYNNQLTMLTCDDLKEWLELEINIKE